MKKLGFLMITIGFLSASLAAVWQTDAVYWSYFIPALAIGATGVALVRTGHRRITTAEGKLAANIESAETALRGIVENMAQLNDQKESINTYDIRHRVDELFREDLMTFVESRQSIAHLYGLSAYGDIMSCFAAGERYLNRVWSASADGYVDEVNAYLDKAREQFAICLEKTLKLKQ